MPCWMDSYGYVVIYSPAQKRAIATERRRLEDKFRVYGLGQMRLDAVVSKHLRKFNPPDSR